MLNKTPRRVVTGLDSQGRSAILSDARDGSLLWRSKGFPVDNRDDGALAGAAYGPGPDTTHFVFSEIPPGDGLHGPGMHATDTIDYVVVMQGSVVIVTETGETELHAGDTLIDRGVVHGWRNDGDTAALMAVVMVGAHPLEPAQ